MLRLISTRFSPFEIAQRWPGVVTVALSCIAIACVENGLVRRAFADEGMIPMSELANVDLAGRGIELTASELFSADSVSLVGGVCRVNGCTGSFVSDQGLIITNHHCAYDAIQKASSPQRDLLLDGFKADSLADEISAPDYTVRVTESFLDVSEKVLSVVTPGMTFLERTRAIEKRRKELETEAEKEHPELRAEVAEMFAGKTYVLFLYTYLKDVRLAFAPPQSIGNFGGEEDNWMWPRHTGDFSFMRAYTSPDGSSATFAKENIPYRPKRFIQVAPQGVQENDTVFLLGYPGKTARQKTVSFLKYEQSVRLPTIVDLYGWQIELLTAAGKEDRAIEIQHASRIRGLANVEKRSRGQLKGLLRAGIIGARSEQESKLQVFIDSDTDRQAKFGNVLSELDATYAEISAAASFEIHFDQLRSASRAVAFGFTIYDAAIERQKADLDREPDYMDRNWEQTVQKLKTSMTDFHAPTEKKMLTGMLERLTRLPESQGKTALSRFIEQPSDIESQASRLIEQTRLGDPAFVAACLEKGPGELAKINDAMLQWVIQLYPQYLQLRETDKAREGRLSQLYGSLIEVKQQFLATDFIPDANGTLRLTSGKVRGYSPEDAVEMKPISTLTGLVNRTTGIEPFITPLAVLEKHNAGEFGSFRNETIGDVPVAILYDTDTTGGNSGSPVFNSQGNLVGVNFDRCFEATINDFAWNSSYSRSIGVDIRYVLWVTGIAYGADSLLQEMGVE